MSKFTIWIVCARDQIDDHNHPEKERLWRSNVLAKELADRGHHVIRWCSSFSHQKKQQISRGSERIQIGKFQCQYIGVSGYRSHIGIARIRSHRALRKEFIKLAENTDRKPDLIHVSNIPLELATACFEFAEKYQLPIVVDLIDFWPDHYMEFLPKYLAVLKVPGIKLLNALMPRVRRMLRQATALTGLTDAFLEWAYEKAPDRDTQFDAVFPMAYPALPKLDKNERLTLRLKHHVPGDAMVLIYAGILGYQADFDLLVEAAQQLSGANIRFLIAGTGPFYETLKARTEALENISFPGWLEKQTLEEYLLMSDFGLVIYHANGPFTKNIPNKFPEYASAGLALLCGTKGLMWEEVKKWHCGVCFERHDFVRLLKNLSQDAKPLAVWKHNARRMHRELYDVEQVKVAMADHVEAVIEYKQAK